MSLQRLRRGAFAAIAMSMLATVATAQKSDPPKETPPKIMPAAQLLACVDADERVELGDPRVVAMRKRLDRAKVLFKEKDEPIRNLVIANFDELKEAKTPTSCLAILEDLIEIKTYFGAGPDDFVEVDSIYMVARVDGKQDRKKAVASIKATHDLLKKMARKKK